MGLLQAKLQKSARQIFTYQNPRNQANKKLIRRLSRQAQPTHSTIYLSSTTQNKQQPSTQNSQ